MWNSWQQDTVPRYELLKDDTLAAVHGITTNIIDTGNFITNAATLDFSFQDKPFQPLQDKVNAAFSHLLSENGSERFPHVSNAWNTTASLAALALGGSGVAKGGITIAGFLKNARFTKTGFEGIRLGEKISQQIVTHVTPKNYFSQKTYAEMEKILTKKFGTPRPGAPGGKSFYNSNTKRTFHLHQQKGHLDGKPHVDIRRRGPYPERKYLLRDKINAN